MIKLGATSLLLLLTLSSLVGLADAQAAGKGYEPYAPAAEQVSAPLFVILAYSAIWLVLLLFVLSVWVRQRRVTSELAQIRRQLDQHDPSAS